jgi:hypothetical protein
MNPIKDGAYNRAKADIKDIRHVYLDLDRKGEEALQAIRNSTEVPAPNFVLDTSPGRHQVVWKVSGFNQEEAESLLHNLANQFGGDLAATDSTRVLRLPGFANRKLTDEFIVHARQERAPFTRPVTSGFTKTYSYPQGIWATAKNAHGPYLAGPKANPSTIGRTPSVPSAAATTPNWSSSASPTTARAIKPILTTTRGLRSRKRKPIFRADQSKLLPRRRTLDMNLNDVKRDRQRASRKSRL